MFLNYMIIPSLDSSPLISGPGIYCWRVGGQLIYYLPYFISLNVKTVLFLSYCDKEQKKEKGEATSLYIL